MSRRQDPERYSEDLQEVADVLRKGRPRLSALELDRIKLQTMRGAGQSKSSQRRRFSGSPRLVAFLTVGILAVGGGSAIAGFGGGGFAGFSEHQSASWGQYRCEDGKGNDDCCQQGQDNWSKSNHDGCCQQGQDNRSNGNHDGCCQQGQDNRSNGNHDGCCQQGQDNRDGCQQDWSGGSWQYTHGWGWIPSGNGGFAWGDGNGWVYK